MTGRVLFILSVFLCSALGQEFRGSLAGRITDASGAVVPGAMVSAINEDTNVSASNRSNEVGNYRISFLLPGNYRIVVELAKFKRIERPGIHISVASDTTLDFVLEMGETTQTVTVSGEAPLVSTSNGDLGQVLGHQDLIMASPILERNVMNRVSLMAGVTTAAWDNTIAVSGVPDATSNAQSSFSISGGGGLRAGNEINVDGIPTTLAANSSGNAMFVPSLELVQEIVVHATMFDASLGRSSGGALNITTRGGTNHFHGAIYDYKRWTALDANTWQNNRLNQPRAPTKYNQYGGIIGGPVRIPKLYNGKDRTFFLFSYEYDANQIDYPFQARVPTDLEKNSNFSQTLNLMGTGLVQIYDPSSTVGNVSNVSRTAFTGGIIPASRVSPIGLAVAKLYPAPNLAGAPRISQFNYFADPVQEITQRQNSGRVDHAIGARQRMFVRLSRLDRGQFLSSGLPFPNVFSAPVVGTNPFGNSPRTFYSAGVDDTIVFSPTLVGSLRYGFVYRSAPIYLPSLNPPDPASLGLPAGILANQEVKGFPQFTLGENFPAFGTQVRKQTWFEHVVLATFSKTAGSHSWKFGVDYRLTRANTNDPGATASGSFTFSPVFTQANPFVNTSSNTSGSGLASLLLGIPASGSLGYTAPSSVQNHYLGLFAQDEWRIRRNLTLTFGVRYELETPYTERYNRAAYGFDFNAPSPLTVPGLNLRGGLLFAGVGGNPRTMGNPDTNNFGPRFGFAYSLNEKTVFRGGYGIFFSPQAYQTSFLGAVGTFNSVTPYTGTIDNGATPFTTLANPFPSGVIRPIGSAAGLAAQYGTSLTVFDQNRVNPYNQQWQLSIQRALPGQVVIDAAYVGMLSLKRLESFNLNEIPDQYNTAAQNTSVPNPFLGIFDPTSTLGTGSTTTQKQLWVRFPQYTSLTVQGANTGRTVYHALQAKIEKRLQHGLTVVWSYTFSKLINNNVTSLVNARNYRAVSPNDATQVTTLTAVYDLPFGPGKPLLKSQGAIIDRLVGGWSLSAVLHAQSGDPLTITQTNGRPIVLSNPSKIGRAHV